MPSRGTTAHLRAACAYVVLALTLVGCSGGDPEPTPSVGPGTVATTPTRTSTPSPVPSAMREFTGSLTDEGAAEFARHVVELYTYVYSTGDLSEWSRLSHADCALCASVAENVRRQSAAGHSWTGGEPEIEDVTVSAITEAAANVVVTAIQAPITITDSAGAVVEQAERARARLTVAVVEGDESWLIRGVNVEELE